MIARDLRGPGLRAYFLYGQKVGKKPLKPGGLRIPHFLISFAPEAWSVLSTVLPSASFPFCVYFSVVIENPYRLGLANSPGCFLQDVPLDQIPVDGSTPLKGRQPELVNYQAPRSDARRTCRSRGTATLHFHPMFANPSPRTRRIGGAEKGSLNRRFKWLFAFFLSTQKEGGESGGEKPPG